MSYILGHFFVIMLVEMIYLTTPQLAFCIVVPIIIVIILGLVLFFPLYKRYIANNFKMHCYHKIHQIAQIKDYYLINNFTFKSDDINTTVIDHLLFGNKYIYVIQDQYIEGDLTGKDTDSDLVVINKNGSKNYVGGNPYISSNALLRKLSASTTISTELMISITLVNDDCKINILSNSKQFFVVQRKKLTKLISIVENRNVGNINQENLAKAVKIIADGNLKDK